MIGKRLSFAAIGTLSLLLAGCDDGENLETMQEATEELDRLKTETVDELNQLYATEADLQEAFSDTLETDAELSTMEDGSSPVFDNIEAREAILSTIEELEDEMEQHQDTLDSYDGEQLDSEEVTTVSENVNTFQNHLSQYRDRYSSTLNEQHTYFTGLSDSDATYDDFVAGIQSVNEERDELRETLLELDEFLVSYRSNLNTLSSSIDAQLAED
ncbi:hypothetical protein ADIAL_2071 [Alkalibacterium sp. AK22]|uniref:YkyA family protein n=1 Tax=Alkalibacterium sp. AK22 TaxID=1229520 RepID=UPI0004469B06|nr:YkyA family protein [Alkalibacterium sp. AK22]EXJ22485.1 hypothetical protein ADIAL_2071 [Alkalibacterium sp. AK22]